MRKSIFAASILLLTSAAEAAKPRPMAREEYDAITALLMRALSPFSLEFYAENKVTSETYYGKQEDGRFCWMDMKLTSASLVGTPEGLGRTHMYSLVYSQVDECHRDLVGGFDAEPRRLDLPEGDPYVNNYLSVDVSANGFTTVRRSRFSTETTTVAFDATGRPSTVEIRNRMGPFELKSFVCRFPPKEKIEKERGEWLGRRPACD